MYIRIYIFISRSSHNPSLIHIMPVDLTPENLEEIQAYLRSKGWISATAKVASLSSAGEGNMNRTLRAALSSNDGPATLILKQSVPYVEKYPMIAAPEGRIDVEAAFYRTVAGSGADAVQAYLPKMLHHDPEERIICLEDLGGAEDMTAAYAGESAGVFDTKHRSALLGWLEALHGVQVDEELAGKTFVNRDMRVLNHEHIFDLPLRPENGVALDGFTIGLQDIAEDYILDEKLRARAGALGDIYLGKEKKGDGGRKSVLLHGDFYPGSFLSNSETGVKVIDPEFAFFGPAEFDLGVLVAHCCFCQTSPAEAERSLSAYGADFDRELALAFAGLELIRRLLGVAQLPLPSETALATKERWLRQGRDWIMAWNP